MLGAPNNISSLFWILPRYDCEGIEIIFEPTGEIVTIFRDACVVLYLHKVRKIDSIDVPALLVLLDNWIVSFETQIVHFQVVYPNKMDLVDFKR